MAIKISKEIFNTISVSNAGQSNGLPDKLETFATEINDKHYPILVGKTTGEMFVQSRQKWQQNAPVTDVDGKPVNETVCFVEVQYADSVLKVKMNGLLKAETVEKDGFVTMPAKTVKFRCLKGQRADGGNWYAAMLTSVCTPLEAKTAKDVIPENWGKKPAMTAEEIAAENARKAAEKEKETA